MSRHVVLVRRDPSLGLALRALLHGTGRVTELLTIHDWSELPAETVDAVVIDLPTPRRTQAIDLIRSHFDGRLVLVLDPSDDPAAVPSHHHCSVLQRPFEIVELWHLVTTDPTPGRSANGERAAAGEERASAQQGEGRPEPAAAGAPAASGDEPGRTPAEPATPDEGGPPGVDASTWRWRGRRYGPATAIPPDSPGGGPAPSPGPGDARPGARTGEPTGAAGPSAAPATGAQRGPATRDGPSGSQGDEPRSEGRRGAVPHRPADPPSEDQPGREPETPGGPRSSTSEPTPPSARSGSPRPTTRPDSPASSPAPEERSTERPAPDQVARRTAPTGPGGADRPAGSPATGEPSPADAGPERPSLFRRLSSRLGGYKPEVEIETSTMAETSTEVRSASVPAFEPPPPPPEGSPEQTGPPVWPAPEVQARSAQGDLRSPPATPPPERPATPPPERPATPPPERPATSEPVAAPPPTPAGPTAPPTPSTPDRTPDPSRRSTPPLRPTRPGSTSRPQGPFRPTRPSARPPRRPSPSQPPRTAEPRPPTRREADAPRASEPHRPKDQARPAREEVAPAGGGPVQPDDGPQPAGKEPTPTRQPQPAATQATPDRTEPGPAAAPPAEAVPAGRADPVPVTSDRDETREQPEPQAASAEPKQAAAGAEPDPEVVEAQPAPTAVRDEPDSAAVAALADPAPVPSANAAIDPAPPPPGNGPDPKRRPRGRQPGGGLPPMPTWPSLPPTGPIPAGGAPAGESDRPRRQQPAARSQPAQPAAQTRPPAAPSSAQPTAPPEAPPPARPPGRDPEAAETKPRPGSGPLGVPPDGPEALLAAAEAAAAAPGPLLGTPARPPGTAPTETDEDATTAGQAPPDRRQRGRRARSLLRFTAPRRPDQTERGEPSSPDEPQPLADFDRLTHSIESVTEALGGQPLEFYERDLPQIAAAETARRVRADVVVLLLDNGEGLMEVSGGVGLTPAERRLNVEYSRDVMRELFRAGVGLVEDTDRVRGALAGIPGSRAETLVMVPLVHERLGFGVLMAGRNRSQTGVPTEVFTDAEIEVLMGFADAAAASLRTAVLLRHLKGQLKALEEDD